MPDFAQFQDDFGRALAGGSVIADARIARALAVHRNTSHKAAIDALAANYPVVAALIGDEAFAGVARDYLAAHPPVDPRLCFYGDAFAGFIAAHPALVELPYLGDVAMVERLVVEALFAADAAALDGAAIGARLDGSGPIAPHPAARWAALASPTASIWLAHQPDAAADAIVQIEWAPETVLVTRPDDAVIVTIVAPGAAPFLDACAAGQPIGEAAAVAGDDLAGLFATLITTGAFA
jgi:hypothetical protein